MLLSSTVNDGIIQTLDRLCQSTTNSYPYKNKVTDLNNALDWYFQLAFKADGQWSFDDINQTNPPIDTQNLVSGTNRYKVSAFTEKILDLIKLEVLDSSGNGRTLYPETFDSLGVSPLGNNLAGNLSGVLYPGVTDSFQQLYINAPSGTPTNYVKLGDYIYLRPNPSYNSTGGLKAYFNRPALKFSFVSCTVTIATPGVFTATAHGLSNGDTLILETDGALPTGLSVDTQYYVVSATTDTFQVSATSGGSAINTTGSQSGNHAFLKTSGSPGIIQPHHMMLVRKAALTYLNYTNSFKVGELSTEVAKDELAIQGYYSRRSKDMRKRLMPTNVSNK